jgi:AcrR family transcriptional regulator
MLREADVAGRSGVEDTRLRIFAATRTLYASKGSRGTTTREVAERAGVNEATLFRHFGTKRQLLDAMLEYYTQQSPFPELLDRVGRLATIQEQLRELAVASVDALKRKEDLIKISMAEEIANPEGSTCAWRAPVAARVKLTEFFAAKVAAGELRGEAQWLSRTFMSLFFSLVMARGIWGDEALTPDEAVTTMVDIFLNGARAH